MSTCASINKSTRKKMDWKKLVKKFRGKTETLSLECSDRDCVRPVQLTKPYNAPGTFADLEDSIDFYTIDLYKLGKAFENRSGFEGINRAAVGKKVAIGSLLYYTRQKRK